MLTCGKMCPVFPGVLLETGPNPVASHSAHLTAFVWWVAVWRNLLVVHPLVGGTCRCWSSLVVLFWSRPPFCWDTLLNNVPLRCNWSMFSPLPCSRPPRAGGHSPCTSCLLLSWLHHYWTCTCLSTGHASAPWVRQAAFVAFSCCQAVVDAGAGSFLLVSASPL